MSLEDITLSIPSSPEPQEPETTYSKVNDTDLLSRIDTNLLVRGKLIFITEVVFFASIQIYFVKSNFVQMKEFILPSEILTNISTV